MFNQWYSTPWAPKFGNSIPEKTKFWLAFTVCEGFLLLFAILFTIFVTAFKATNPFTILTSVGFFLTLVGNFFNALTVDDTGSLRSKNPHLGMIISGITFVFALFSAIAVFTFSDSFVLGTEQCQMVQLITCVLGAFPILLFSAYTFYQSYQTPSHAAEAAPLTAPASSASYCLAVRTDVVSSNTSDATLDQSTADASRHPRVWYYADGDRLVPQNNKFVERLRFQRSISKYL